MTYTVAKCSNDVCALRIDFLTFSTVRDSAATPDEANACADIFTITVSTIISMLIKNAQMDAFRAPVKELPLKYVVKMQDSIVSISYLRLFGFILLPFLMSSVYLYFK